MIETYFGALVGVLLLVMVPLALVASIGMLILMAHDVWTAVLELIRKRQAKGKSAEVA